MSGWAKFLMTANVLLLSAVIGVFGYDAWLARSEHEQLTQERVSEMTAGVEQRLRQYTDESTGQSEGAVATAQPMSNEELRETIKASIKAALKDKSAPEPGAGALQAASSFSIELGARTQELLERLTDQAANLAEVKPVASPVAQSDSVTAFTVNGNPGTLPRGEMTDAALMTRVIDGMDSAPPMAAGPVARSTAKDDRADSLSPGERRRLTEVHFSPSSAELSPGALRKTREAADELKLLNASKVTVVGFTDTTGSRAHNEQLARERAESVAKMLADLGVPSDRIEIVGRGEIGGPESTLDDVDEPLNRCVGIIAFK